MAKLALKNVSYTYNIGTAFASEALKDVSVDFEENAMTGIIGHTGSGKSTLVQLLNGLLEPQEGQVLFDGEDVHKTKDTRYHELLKTSLENGQKISKFKLKKQAKKDVLASKRTLCFHVGLVMQYPEYQLFEETVEKDIAFGPKNMGLSDEEIHRRVLETIKLVGLNESYLDQSPFDLSGGQKRRVAIAGVLAMEPDVLVLDEPAAGLDPRGRRDIFNSIKAYQEEKQSTVLIVSHSMEDMAQYCDRVLVMNHGKVFMHDKREEVFSHATELAQIGLDVPRITQLMTMLRNAGVSIPEGLFTVDDAIREVLRFAKREEGRNE